MDNLQENLENRLGEGRWGVGNLENGPDKGKWRGRMIWRIGLVREKLREYLENGPSDGR